MLEMIHVQAAENDRNSVASLLEEFAIEMSRASPEVEVSIYRHAAVASDLCIMLKSRSGPQDKNATHIGLRLAASLKSIGLVDHTCWVEWLAHNHSERERQTYNQQQRRPK